MHRLRIRENSLRQNQEEPSMKTTIRKRFPILRLAAVLCLFLGGCGAKSLDLNALRQSDGSYDFADIPLGSSVEEAAKALGVSLKEPAYQHDGTDVYQAEGPYSLDGKKLKVTLEFTDDGLQMISFFPEAAEGVYDALYEKLTAAYGEPDEVIDSSGEAMGKNLTSQGAQWIAEGEPSTQLILVLITSDSGSTSLSIRVGYGL